MNASNPERSLHKWSFKVIGLGGIGSSVAQGLAQFLAFQASDCRLSFVDGDTFHEANRSRVLFEQYENKAVVKARELNQALDGRIKILPIPRYLNPRNIRRWVKDGDVLFLCVDNHATRKLVNDRCRELKNVLLISGGNDGIENGQTGTFGNVQLFVRRHGLNHSNPLTRFHPEISDPQDKRPDEVDCLTLSHSAPQLLFTNFMVAAAMLGSFYAWHVRSLDYEELYFDIAQGSFTKARRKVIEHRPKTITPSQRTRKTSVGKKLPCNRLSPVPLP